MVSVARDIQLSFNNQGCVARCWTCVQLAVVILSKTSDYRLCCICISLRFRGHLRACCRALQRPSRNTVACDIQLRLITDLYQIDWKQRRSRPTDRKSRAPGADWPRPQREFARAPLAASNSTDTTAFATGYIACTVHMSLNIALQTTWLCT